MKKLKTLLILAALPLAQQAFSADYGAILTNDTRFNLNGSDNTKLLKQKDSITAYATVPLAADGSCYFSAEGLFQYSYTNDFDIEFSSDELIADVTLFKLSKSGKLGSSKYILSAGRFFYSEFSNLVFSQTSDAVNFKIANPSIEVSAFGAYTGLLNKKTVSMLDKNGMEFAKDSTKDFYEFASPQIFAGISIGAPYLFCNQTLIAEGFALLEAEGPGEKGDQGSRFYGTAGLTGPLSSTTFYNLSTTFGFNKDGDVSNLSKATVNFYTSFYSSVFTAGAVYASGESGGLKAFNAVTKNSACFSLSEPAYSSLIKGSLSYSIKPSTTLLAAAGADVLFSSADETKYRGTQGRLSVSYRPYSDVELSLGATSFFAEESSENRTCITFRAVLSL
ncbi:MAG: hypothetical protein J5780_07030 [Treponema sp.]|nr:hypothetical protein [Treponema sp.]